MEKINVDLPTIPNFTNAKCDGDFTIAITNQARDELELYKQDDGYILKYHDMTCRLSDDDAQKFIYHCVKVVEAKKREPLTPPYSKADKLRGYKLPVEDKPKSLLSKLLNILK